MRKPGRTIRPRSYKDRKPYGTYRTVRVEKRKKKKKKRSYGVYIVAFGIVVILIFLFGMAFLTGNRSNKVFESDMVIKGALGQGESTPNFKVNENHKIIITISEYNSPSGDSLVIELWGAGNDWYKVCEGNNKYSVWVDVSSMYNIHFAVNRLYDSGQVSFHVRIEVE